MPYNQSLTERVKILSTIMTSKCLVSSSKQTNTIDMSEFRRLVVIGQALGTAATSTVPHATIKILDSTAKGTVTSTAIVTGTIMSQTAGYARTRNLEIRAENVGQNCVGTTRGRYVRVRAIYGTRGAQVTMVVLGADPRYGAQSNTVTTTST